MKFKVGYENIKGFSNPVKKVKENNNWIWWGLFGMVVIMGVLFVLKMSGRI